MEDRWKSSKRGRTFSLRANTSKPRPELWSSQRGRSCFARQVRPGGVCGGLGPGRIRSFRAQPRKPMPDDMSHTRLAGAFERLPFIATESAPRTRWQAALIIATSRIIRFTNPLRTLGTRRRVSARHGTREPLTSLGRGQDGLGVICGRSVRRRALTTDHRGAPRCVLTACQALYETFCSCRQIARTATSHGAVPCTPSRPCEPSLQECRPNRSRSSRLDQRAAICYRYRPKLVERRTADCLLPCRSPYWTTDDSHTGARHKGCHSVGHRASPEFFSCGRPNCLREIREHRRQESPNHERSPTDAERRLLLCLLEPKWDHTCFRCDKL